LTAATFHQNLDDDVRETFSLANGVDHCHDHQHLDDRRLGHQGRRRDDQHQDHQGRRREHRNYDLGRLGDQRQDPHLDDQLQGHLDALGHQCQLGHGRGHLQEDDQFVRPHRRLGDQRQGHLGVGPLVDDQLQGRLVGNCLGVAELDDRYLEAAELDDHLVQCAVQLVQQQVRLAKK
jgi:hypothetical protein